MSENTGDQTTNFVELAGDIVSALATGAAAASPEAEIEKPTAAQIRKSVMPEGIISFIDGKPYKTLKRHLKTHGLDPYSYRQRYGLPAEYPMVAAEYAKQRSDLAKSIGLGRSVDRGEAA
jgi:predicted transcriptional regulator